MSIAYLRRANFGNAFASNLVTIAGMNKSPHPKTTSANWHIGTVGFGYDQWQGVFYPPALKPSRYLSHYAQFYTAVEIDSTFYGTPPPDRVQRWAQAVPDHFRFAVKTPRFITHDLRLQTTAVADMHTFLQALAPLGQKLGTVLIQLPPDFTTAESTELTTFLDTLPSQTTRFALEFRHLSWETRATADLLRARHICWAAADYVIMPKKIHPTADFLYLRLLGKHGRYQSKDHERRDPTADLQHWLDELGKEYMPPFSDIFAFANNDFAGYSPRTANRLKELVGQPTAVPQIPRQVSLF
ncbi:MAG: DUF72 domain-containing protein [Anaerolineales bacterium]|nr:DUF72 domain-containing protein [Anaerolineales bacterium]